MVFNPAEVAKLSSDEAQLTLYAHMVPVVGTLDHFRQGNRVSGILSAAGDVFLIGGFVCRAGKTLTEGVILTTTAVGETGLAVTQVSIASYKAYQSKDPSERAANIGDAFLSMLFAAGAIRQVVKTGALGQLRRTAQTTGNALSTNPLESTTIDIHAPASQYSFDTGTSSVNFVHPMSQTSQQANDLSNLQSTVRFLREQSVSNKGVRRAMIETGYQGTIGSDTPLTLARFQKLFPQTIRNRKAFKGRLGDIETRVATINEALEMERGGIRPQFEVRVKSPTGSADIDLVGRDPLTDRPVRAVQFVRAIPRSGGRIVFDDREARAAEVIEKALGRHFPAFVVTGP